jgi:hypothetical protein
MANVVELSSVAAGRAHAKSRVGAVWSFIVWPLRIVVAMKPQREREAERIVADFGTDRWCDALERRLDGRLDRDRGL